MPAPNNLIKITLIAVLCWSFAAATQSSAQNPAQEQGDVVRVFTDLVQTDVMFFPWVPIVCT